jgi:O-antigen/teichoic acid export membrane protein
MGMADRVVLGLFLPLQTVGLYLIGSTIAGLLKLYPVAFEAAWMPFAFDSMQRPDARTLFARLATYACAVLTLAAVVVAGFGGMAIAMLLPNEYLAASEIVPTLVLGMTIQSLAWFFATSLNIAKKTRIYPAVTAIGTAASLASNLLLIPRFGLFGAALSVVVSQALATGATLYFAQRAYHIPYEVGRLTKLAAVSIGTYLAMIAVPAIASWEALAARAGLLALFPIGLYGLRFFEPNELGSLRALVRPLA